MAEKHYELKSLLMKVKGESGKAVLKLSIKTNKQKTNTKNNIIEFGPTILRYNKGIQLNK